MSGVSISVTISDAAVRRAFDRLAVLMDDTTPVMKDIGEVLVSSTHRRFVSQSGPDGQAWLPNNPDYAASKRNSRILTESGRLRDSITSDPGRDQVTVGSNVIYAAIHQFGGTIKPKSASHLVFRIGGRLVFANSVTLPSRPFLGISSEDETEIAEIVFDRLGRISGQP